MKWQLSYSFLSELFSRVEPFRTDLELFRSIIIPKMTNSQAQKLVIQLIWQLVGEESPMGIALMIEKMKA